MELQTILKYLAVIALAALILATVLLGVTLRKLRRIPLPPNADFFTTVRAVPLTLMIGLDLLDLALDILSTPIIWLILNRYNLQALRNVASFEALIPFTGPIPTMSLSWLAARAFGLGQPYDPNIIETVQIGPDQYAPRPGNR